jgi:hypothetical protein
MADISAFPAIRNVLVYGDNIISMTATTAVKAGQVVAIADAGVSMAVDKAVKGSGQVPVGVALYDIAAGAVGAICGPGCIVYVANADDTATIDAGHDVIMNDNAVGGTVSEILAVGSASTPQMRVGVMYEDMAASGTAKMRITCDIVTEHA